MADSSRFDFCPKCGALSRDGVCQSCGYVNQDIIKEMEAAQPPVAQQPTPPAYMQQPYARPVNVTPMQGSVMQAPAQNQPVMQPASAQASMTQPSVQPPMTQPSVQPPMAQPDGQPSMAQPSVQPPVAQQPAPPAYMQPPMAQQPTPPAYMQQPYARPVNVTPMQGSVMQAPAQNQPVMQPASAQASMAQPSVQPPMAQPSVQPPMAQQPMQPPMYQSGYGAVPPGQYPGYAPAVPPAQPPKKKGGTAVAICILAGIVLVALVALILVGVRLLEKEKKEQESRDAFRSDYERTEKMLEEDFTAPEETKDPGETGSVGETQPDSTEPVGDFSFYELDVTEQNRNESGQDPDIPYYSGPYNSLRDDLSYEIAFTEAIYYATGLNASVDVEYPQVVSDDMENKDYINEALRYEFEYYRDYFSSEYKAYMTSEQDAFVCEVDSFVTYMDEKILSVVFYEKIALKLGYETYQGINFYCLNFDLETGTLMDNTEVLYMDDDFAVDFRRREVEENGEEALTAYSDQEILSMLGDDTTLVLFYTPMGLEVGVNMEERIVYVTYADYENYLNDF